MREKELIAQKTYVLLQETKFYHQLHLENGNIIINSTIFLV